MLQKFKDHIETKLPFLKKKKLLIAISGGVDSVVLTFLMHQLNFEIALIHCNFQLRGDESDLDEQLIKDLASELNIEVFATSFQTKEHARINKLSTQVAARELRYAFFKEIVQEHKFDYVLTAHHSDDNLETFLINLTRGTGLEGLIGIPVKNGNIIRPLLIFSRLDILNYAEENQIKWREDQSNSEQKYVRNKIRHNIIPVLKEINPSLLSSFNKTSTYLQESVAIISDRLQDVSEKIIEKEGEILKLNIAEILKLSNPKAYLYQILKKYNFYEWNKVNNLLKAQSGKYLLSNSHMLLKNREFLVLSPLTNAKFNSDNFYYFNENSKDNFDFPLKIKAINDEEVKVDGKKNILVDKNLVIYPLIVRKWKKGDFFYPTGMLGKKKISKYFKDEKLSLLEKNNVWLLCNKEGDIIWVIGLRQDRRFKINSNTKSIIKISI